MVNGGAKTPKNKSAAQKSAALRQRMQARNSNAMSDGNAGDDLADMFSAFTLGRPTVKRTRKVVPASERREPSMRMRNVPQHFSYSPEAAKKRTASNRRTSTGNYKAAHYKGLTEKQSLRLAHLLSGVTSKKERAIIYKSFYAGVRAENKTMDDLSTMFGRI
jgi:hypothetical protein